VHHGGCRDLHRDGYRCQRVHQQLLNDRDPTLASTLLDQRNPHGLPGWDDQIVRACGRCGYVWSTGAQTQCITVGAGTYTVTVTDANGCMSSCSTTVTQLSPPPCSISGTSRFARVIRPTVRACGRCRLRVEHRCADSVHHGGCRDLHRDGYRCQRVHQQLLNDVTQLSPPPCSISGTLTVCRVGRPDCARLRRCRIRVEHRCADSVHHGGCRDLHRDGYRWQRVHSSCSTTVTQSSPPCSISGTLTVCRVGRPDCARLRAMPDTCGAPVRTLSASRWVQGPTP